MPSVHPKFYPKDVTVVIPTLAAVGDRLMECIVSVWVNGPGRIIVVTPWENVDHLREQLRFFSDVSVLGSDIANKRFQMVHGLRLVKSPITVFADDDITWPRSYLSYVLATFEDAKVGAAGSCQRLLRPLNPNFWNFLEAVYLERRNFEFSATLRLDGKAPRTSHQHHG